MNAKEVHTLGRIILYGAGGHAAVVAATIDRIGADEITAVIDDGIPAGTPLLRWQVQGTRDELPALHAQLVTRVHVAIGANAVRACVSRDLMAMEFNLHTVVHPAAVIEDTAWVGDGSFVAAQAFIGVRSRAGTGCIINTAASIDHDCRIGDFSHVCPGARIPGDVVIGARVMVGTGATVLPGVRVGDDAVIGAGAVVTRDVEPGRTVAGNPARPLPPRAEQ